MVYILKWNIKDIKCKSENYGYRIVYIVFSVFNPTNWEISVQLFYPLGDFSACTRPTILFIVVVVHRLSGFLNETSNVQCENRKLTSKEECRSHGHKVVDIKIIKVKDIK